MPIYEYACRSCEHQFETIHKATEEPLRDCPECGEAALKKLLSAPVFRLKGSGWYETDFKTGDRKNVSRDGRDNGESNDEGSKAKAVASEATDSSAGKSSAGKDKADAKSPASGSTSTDASKPAGATSSSKAD